ncbi:MAG: 50S ribosomal protein L17 [Patescibacteria group bacterium]|nr:50S ribosomal protein L17 [Patescibacteria group bacterium]
MRHRISGRHLGRNKKTRKQLLCNLARSVIVGGRIETTLAKAKAVQPLAERLVTYAKSKNLGIKRLALKRLNNDRKTWEILVNNVAPVFSNVNGGYTRIVKLINRKGDNSPMAILEWSKKMETGTVKKSDENIESKVKETNKTKTAPKRKAKKI